MHDVVPGIAELRSTNDEYALRMRVMKKTGKGAAS